MSSAKKSSLVPIIALSAVAATSCLTYYYLKMKQDDSITTKSKEKTPPSDKPDKEQAEINTFDVRQEMTRNEKITSTEELKCDPATLNSSATTKSTPLKSAECETPSRPTVPSAPKRADDDHTPADKRTDAPSTLNTTTMHKVVPEKSLPVEEASVEPTNALAPESVTEESVAAVKGDDKNKNEEPTTPIKEEAKTDTLDDVVPSTEDKTSSEVDKKMSATTEEEATDTKEHKPEKTEKMDEDDEKKSEVAESDLWEFLQKEMQQGRRCAGCNAEEEGSDKKFKPCAKCRTVLYCSKDCQKKNWKQHKKVCCK